MKRDIINLRPISSSTCTGYLPFYGSNCGLKGAAILHNWLPCAIQACGTQALAVPFCISACDMDKFKKELKEAVKMLGIAVIAVPVFLALLYGFASVMASIFDTPDTKTSETPSQLLDNKKQDFAKRLADELVKEDNTDLLYRWARSHNIDTPHFTSATTLREEIRRNSKDFSLYNNESVFNALFIAITGTDDGLRVWSKVTSDLEKK